MALKKWLLLLTSAWLINTLVCFHGSNPFEKKTSINVALGKHHLAPQSLLLLVKKVINDVSQDHSETSPKIKYLYRYVVRQYPFAQAFGVTAGYTISWSPHCFVISVLAYTKYQPDHTTSLLFWLFRLTPF